MKEYLDVIRVFVIAIGVIVMGASIAVSLGYALYLWGGNGYELGVALWSGFQLWAQMVLGGFLLWAIGTFSGRFFS